MGRLGSEYWRSVLMDNTWQQETAVGTCSKRPEVTEVIRMLWKLTCLRLCAQYLQSGLPGRAAED